MVNRKYLFLCIAGVLIIVYLLWIPRHEVLGTALPPAVNGEPVSDWKNFKKSANGSLRATLTALQFEITQRDGTEAPFHNEYADNHKEGIYVDVVSGEPLFSSRDKYDSGTGWPSFTKPLVLENIVEKKDYSLGAPRFEIRSKHADSHLGICSVMVRHQQACVIA